MLINKTAYLITIGDPCDNEDHDNAIITDEFEETLIFVNRLIERLSNNGNYIKQDNLFSSRYLIEK